MSMFIKLLFESQQTINQGLTVQQRQLQLNHQAILIYKQACQETRYHNLDSAQKFNEMLLARINVWVTEELAELDCLLESNYIKLIGAINAWQILPTDPAFEHCQLIRHALITLLPDVKKKQKLQELCYEYKAYLKADIETRLRRDHTLVYEAYSAKRRTIVEASPGSGQMPILIMRPGKNMERFVASHRRGVAGGAKQLNLAIQKYAAVSALERTLVQHKPLPTQLTDFHWQFQQQRAVMIKDRDTAMMKFVKGVVTILSIGIAAVVGIWNVKSKTLGKQLQGTLSLPTHPLPVAIR